VTVVVGVDATDGLGPVLVETHRGSSASVVLGGDPFAPP
jgi:hypothetical protein